MASSSPRPFSAFIVEAVRTAGGKKNGRLSKWHPADMGAAVVDELVRRTAVTPADVDDVIFGCVSQIGAQSGNIGRSIVLSSQTLPISVPGTTVDRQCGSGQQAIHFAAQAVMSGTQDIVIAGGVESMSLVPIGASVLDGMKNGRGHPQGDNINKKWPGVQFSQFHGAELMASTYKLSRAELDQLAYSSHQKAANAIKNGYFNKEIVALKGQDAKGNEVVHNQDEGVRAGAKLEQMAAMKTLSDQPGAVITAASASQICDGAAALMIVNERGLKKLGSKVRARARIVTMALAGADPVIMLSAPIPAAARALKQANLSINDIDLYEVNEAFASVPAAWVKELKGDINKLNVNGGACALGHPLGATGVKLMTTLVHELERRNGRYGILAICEGGGTANATIIERCQPDGSSASPAACPRSRL